VEADLLAKLLSVKSPAFRVGRVSAALAELGDAAVCSMVIWRWWPIVGDGLVINIAAVGGVGDSNGDATGTLSVRRTVLIVSCGGGLERRDGLDGLDGDCGFRQEVEEIREIRLHLGDVLAKVCDDRFRRDGMILGVVFDVVAEGSEVLVAVGFGEGGHLRAVMRSTSFSPISWIWAAARFVVVKRRRVAW
jgi:hypothetical protein